MAIGGGSLALRETWSIDRDIVRLSEQRRPRALFIPTASSDNLDYWISFRSVYDAGFKCQCDLLLLLKNPPTAAQRARMINAADIIYVGGGNTLKMMRRWRLLGVDKLLDKARRRGAVLSGVSAGANCWFAYGHSDSMKFYHPENWSPIRVRGLGYLPATCCPHYHAEGREEAFAGMLRRRRGTGIAIDNHTALEVVGDTYRVRVSRDAGRAYQVKRGRSETAVTQLPKRQSYSDLNDLL